MHAVVKDSLEEYLSGTLKPEVQRNIEAHLSICRMCRDEIAAMKEISLCFRVLEAPQELQPAPGFYAQVMRQVGDRHAVPAFAGFFALDFAFGRRLVFASLITLAVLGSYLITTESEYPTGLSPAAVMAQQDSPDFEAARGQDNMLATLTTYEP
jgi:predicted anti-sigma-YlaC factor YlaD